MKKILNALFLTIITLVTFSCSDVPSPYDITEGGGGEGPALTGDGTKENPYDIASAMVKQDGEEAWVKGYIVGSIKDKDIKTESEFAPPFTNAANILIAASANESDYKKCIPVQLVGGTDIRTALNLKDNEGNLGKAVIIKGQLIKYFGVAGLKTPTAAVLDGKDVGGSGTDPEPGDKDNPFGLDPSNPVDQFEANFDDATANADYTLAGWINASAQGDRKWQGKTFNNTTGGVDKYIQATAQGATAGQTYESWFITPAFTVNNIQDKKVTFDCGGAYYVATSSLKVYFLELVNNKMEKTVLDVAGIPTSGANYAWTTGLSIDLTSFAGKVGFIGFQYIGIGGMSTSTTYTLDNIKAGEGSGGTDPDPDPVGDNLIVNPSFETWTEKNPDDWARVSVTNVTYEKSTTTKTGTNAVLLKGNGANARFGSRDITLPAGTYILSVYSKKTTASDTELRMGYVPIKDDGTPDSSNYKYQDPADKLTDDWVLYSREITFAAETKISIFFASSKNNKAGTDLLIDDISLVKK